MRSAMAVSRCVAASAILCAASLAVGSTSAEAAPTPSSKSTASAENSADISTVNFPDYTAMSPSRNIYAAVHIGSSKVVMQICRHHRRNSAHVEIWWDQPPEVVYRAPKNISECDSHDISSDWEQFRVCEWNPDLQRGECGQWTKHYS